MIKKGGGEKSSLNSPEPTIKSNLGLSDGKLLEILLNNDYLERKEAEKILKYVKRQNLSLVSALLSKGLLTKDLLGQALAEYYKLPYADLNTNKPSRAQVLRLPESLAVKYRLVIYQVSGKEIVLATDQPKQKDLLAKIKEVIKQGQIKLAYSLPEDIDESLIHYRKSLKTRLQTILETTDRVAPEIIDQIIDDAVILMASDIHLEPQAKEVVVRFRVDGVLREIGRLHKEYYSNILNRLKVQAHLRLDQHLAAQDGAIRFVRDHSVVDTRLSILPTLDGEKVVLRLLSAYVQDFTLNDLGLSPANQKLLLAAAKKPYGMILVAGPTGSGKTTTLYALLKTLNKPEVNITTIEDPVEYRMLNVNQIQVNSQTNLTFAKGLRSIVRQDPDIILVGEIRDQETAEISVNAALTGHLLFSTFHANDAATSVPRLLDMGIEPFLLASTLNLIIAQRLVRKICGHCRQSQVVSKASLQKKYGQVSKFINQPKVTLYQGSGCEACGHTGYGGRTAIYEFISITPELEELILKRPSTQELWRLAKQQGAKSLFEDGLIKVKNGQTTLEELLRVVGLPSE